MTKRLTPKRKKQLSEFYAHNSLEGHNPIKELIDEIDALEAEFRDGEAAWRTLHKKTQGLLMQTCDERDNLKAEVVKAYATCHCEDCQIKRENNYVR